MLDWKYFPHIFDRIYDYLDADGVNVVRLTCTTLRARVETDLWEHITLSCATMMSSSSGSHARPEALVFTQPQTYSTRYGCPLPQTFQGGHPQITKAVNILHYPGRESGGGMSYCDEDWPEDSDEFCDLVCPTAQRLEWISDSVRRNVVIQLLRAHTYHCSDISLVCQCGGFHSCITAYPLRKPSVGTDYLLYLSAPRHIFKLSYPPRGLNTTWPIHVCKQLTFHIRHAIFILHPESSDGTSALEPACLHLAGVEWLVREIAPCATDALAGKVTFVAIESWPPDGPHSLRQLTPQTTAQAFKAALNGCKKYLRRNWPEYTKIMRNIEIVSWNELRDQLGDDTCSLLARDVPPATSTNAATAYMTDFPIPAA